VRSPWHSPPRRSWRGSSPNPAVSGTASRSGAR
jgi:hypothetical protein